MRLEHLGGISGAPSSEQAPRAWPSSCAVALDVDSEDAARRTIDRRGERRRRKVLQIRLIRPLLARPAHTPNPLTMEVLNQLS
jgi:hypothetical protein